MVPGNTVVCSFELSNTFRPGEARAEGIAPGNSKEHPTVLPDTTSASPRYCINVWFSQEPDQKNLNADREDIALTIKA